MRSILFIIVIASSLTSAAQDLTGIWRGHFKSNHVSRLLDTLAYEDRYKFETQIEQKDKAFKGVTYSYKTTVFYGKASCLGAINPKTKKVLLEENGMLELRSSSGADACLMTLFMQYTKVGEEEFLEGTYTSMNLRDSSSCGGGTVFMRKVPVSDFYEEPFLANRDKKPVPPPIAKTTPPKPSAPVPASPKPAAPKKVTPGATAKRTPGTPPKKTTVPKTTAPAKQKTPTAAAKPKRDTVAANKNETLKNFPADSIRKAPAAPRAIIPVPKVLSTRKNELVRTIVSNSKEVLVKIYDNGTIDNDTVSVYIDNKLVISKQRLTEKAITVKLMLEENRDFHELVMVADNLGEIPPNTSLMIVNAGDQQYEVRITSTEQKNALIHFRYEPGAAKN
jgi:hypothetical protein